VFMWSGEAYKPEPGPTPLTFVSGGRWKSLDNHRAKNPVGQEAWQSKTNEYHKRISITINNHRGTSGTPLDLYLK